MKIAQYIIIFAWCISFHFLILTSYNLLVKLECLRSTCTPGVDWGGGGGVQTFVQLEMCLGQKCVGPEMCLGSKEEV